MSSSTISTSTRSSPLLQPGQLSRIARFDQLPHEIGGPPELQKSFRAKLAKLDAPILIVQGDVGEGPIAGDGPGRNRFYAEVLIPELRATRRQFDVKIYHEQAHCFCSASGAPRPGGAAAPASWSAAALEAFRDIDAFCRRHVLTKPKALNAGLVTYEPVRTGPVR